MGLKNVAESLRQSAAELDAVANFTPRTPEGYLRQFCPVSPMTYSRKVDLLVLGTDLHACMGAVLKNAGLEFGLKIGETLRAEYKGLKPGGIIDMAIYETELYVLTREQLASALQNAHRAGREGA